MILCTVRFLGVLYAKFALTQLLDLPSWPWPCLIKPWHVSGPPKNQNHILWATCPSSYSELFQSSVNGETSHENVQPCLHVGQVYTPGSHSEKKLSLFFGGPSSQMSLHSLRTLLGSCIGPGTATVAFHAQVSPPQAGSAHSRQSKQKNEISFLT